MIITYMEKVKKEDFSNTLIDYDSIQDKWKNDAEINVKRIYQNIELHFSDTLKIVEELEKIDAPSAFIELLILIASSDVEKFYKIFDENELSYIDIEYKLITYISYAQTFRKEYAKLLISNLLKIGIIKKFSVHEDETSIIMKNAGVIKYKNTKLNIDFITEIQGSCHQFCECCLFESENSGKIKILSGILEKENFEKIFHSVLEKEGNIIDPTSNLICKKADYIKMCNFEIVNIVDSIDDYNKQYDLLSDKIDLGNNIALVHMLMHKFLGDKTHFR